MPLFETNARSLKSNVIRQNQVERCLFEVQKGVLLPSLLLIDRNGMRIQEIEDDDL